LSTHLNIVLSQEMLAEQREHLTKLLLELMEQRDLRAKEIARRMVSLSFYLSVFLQISFFDLSAADIIFVLLQNPIIC